MPVDCRSNLLHETLGRFMVMQGLYDHGLIFNFHDRFGFSAAPAPPELIVGRWSIDAGPTTPAFAVSTSTALADALEAAGLIGSTLIMDARDGATVQLEAELELGSGRGSVELQGL